MERAGRHVWEDIAAARSASNWELSKVLPVLRLGSIRACELIPWGSNYTFAARLEYDGTTTLAVYKPARGEVPLWDFPRGTLYRREYAAYAVAQAIGWDIVPPTVIRDGPQGIGSVQLWVESDDSDYFHFREQHEMELRRICLFDVITNNADRKAGHCLKGIDGRIWAIDHGLTFNVQQKLRTVIWDFSGDALPAPLRQDLAHFRNDEGRVRRLESVLKKVLAREEVDTFLKRVDSVLANPVYPTSYSRRAFPWPLY